MFAFVLRDIIKYEDFFRNDFIMQRLTKYTSNNFNFKEKELFI